jgi:hypothetical protein
MNNRESNFSPLSSPTFYNIIQLLDVEDKTDNMREIFDGAVSYSKTRARTPIEFRERDLQRFMVNHIRHCNSTYDTYLNQIYKIDRGNHCQYYLYKNIVLDRVGKMYPYLNKECKRQKYKMDMVKVKEVE